MHRLLSAILLAGLSPLAAAATFTVVNTNDAGPGSLRQAILDANSSPGVDTIAFAIPASGVQTIVPLSPLPAIVDPVVIDGMTQPGFSGAPLIELDGENAGAGAAGLDIEGGASIVRGVVVNRFDGYGILLSTLGGNVVEGCYVGTDASGAAARGNGLAGIAIDSGSDSNRVGGTTPAERNLVSGQAIGVSVKGSGAANTIEGNFVGTDVTGILPIRGSIGIISHSPQTIIGGTQPGAGNLVSAHTGDGIQVQAGADLSLIQGNLVGTDASGSQPLGNTGNGVSVAGADDVLVGGTADGARNVISANGGSGVAILGSGNMVQANFIGTDAAGTLPLPNAGSGVSIGLFSSNDTIDLGNVIAFNGDDGVLVASGTGHAIRGNAIFGNAALGIDLLPPDLTTGVTANDPGDADTGANDLQNFPLVVSVVYGPTSTTVDGTLGTSPNGTFDLDFYANPDCTRRPRDFRQGETYLGTAPVTTDANGFAAFQITLPVAIPAGSPVSATATDASGNTSEFSQRLPFSMAPSSGPAAGGTAVTISGTNFAPGAAVTFGGVAATGVTVDSSTQISAIAPALPPGSARDVVVTNVDGSGGVLAEGWLPDFLDVPDSHAFHPYVVALVSNGISGGIGGGLYGVDDSTLRQQAAVLLLRARHGLCYAPSSCLGKFADVPCPSTFADWIEALFTEGITGGCGGGDYCPTNPVRRDQVAVFLLKTEHGSGYVPPPCAGIFMDVPCPSVFADWIEQLAAEMITGGCGGGNYCPLSANTRRQMAVFIVKTFNLQ